jgi:hypothetical protein
VGTPAELNRPKGDTSYNHGQDNRLPRDAGTSRLTGMAGEAARATKQREIHRTLTGTTISDPEQQRHD